MEAPSRSAIAVIVVIKFRSRTLAKAFPHIILIVYSSDFIVWIVLARAKLAGPAYDWPSSNTSQNPTAATVLSTRALADEPAFQSSCSGDLPMGCTHPA